MKLLTETDLSWIADMIDVVTKCQGQPWRVALDRLDGLPPTTDESRRVSQKRVHAVLRAIQRVLGRSTQVDLAKTARALVLGRPALVETERTDRIAAAARSLEVSVATVEQLLWVDLPRERAVELPYGRPDELEIAAFANVQLIESALRRAQTARLRIRGDAGPFLRGAARCGLLTTARPAGEAETIIEIVGPLALFHRTAVYGRALASLVPLLSEVTGFELAISATGHLGDYTIELGSPALLPRTNGGLGAPPRIVMRLAKELRSLKASAQIMLLPPAVVVDGQYVCPDLMIDETYVEIIGFWTAEYLARKRATYESAGLRVVLCVDDARGCAGEDPPDDVVAYTKYIDPTAVFEKVTCHE